MRRDALWVGFFGLFALAGCVDPDEGGGDQRGSRVTTLDIPVYVNRMIDVLFVIDSSTTMAAHQDHLIANYESFMAVLETIVGGLPDVHIGVVTSDLGVSGADGVIAAETAACRGDGGGGRLRTGSAAIAGMFISDLQQWEGRANNYLGPLPQVFGQIANVGAQGCSFSQPLEAMRRALEPNPANAGFLREDAYLFVVLITASDDCSVAHGGFFDGAPDRFKCITHDQELVPVAEYEHFLKTLKADPTKVMLATATGPHDPLVVNTAERRVEPSCTIGDATATPARRIDALRELFPNRNDTTSLCAEALTPVMGLSTQTIRTTLPGAPCIEPRLFDLDPGLVGTQPDCTVWVENAAMREQQRTITQCGTDPPTLPCWRVVADPVNCPSYESPQRLDLLPRWFNYGPEAHIRVECLVE